MATIADILDRYRNLCDYCDGFWAATAAKFPQALACAPGCADCCGLSSVNRLEALCIADFCRKNPGTVSISAEPDRTACAFLTNGRCRIYGARPLICRTHGLLLRGASFRQRFSVSCPYNFVNVNLETLPDSAALDSEKVSENLARLNAALCLLLGDGKKSADRVMLRDLASGAVTRAEFPL